MSVSRRLEREIKRLQYELIQANKRLPYLRLLFEGSRDGLALIDSEGTILEVNGARAGLLGELSSRLIGKKLLSLLRWPANAAPPAELDVWLLPGMTRIAFDPMGGAVELMFNRSRLVEQESLWTCSVRPLTAESLEARQLAHELDHRTPALDGRRTLEAFFDSSPNLLWLLSSDGFVTASNASSRAVFPQSVEGRLEERLAVLAGPIAACCEGGIGCIQTVLPFSITRPRRHFEGHVRVIQLVASSGIVVVLRDITEAVIAREEREEALEQASRAAHDRGVLLQEIHHRVKNNLQLVSSLLGLQIQSSGHDQVEMALRESAFRVRTIALVHQQLYGRSDLSTVDLSQTLTGSLCGSFVRSGTMHFDLTPLEISSESATSIGLILNELILNALKYGRGADDSCHIHLGLRELDDDSFRIDLRDEGTGVPSDLLTRRRSSLGFTIIRALEKQLNARLELIEPGSAHFRLTMPRRSAS